MPLLRPWPSLLALAPLALGACAAVATHTDASADGRDGAAVDAAETAPSPDAASDAPSDTAPGDTRVPGLPFGAACTRDEECDSRVCVTDRGLSSGCGAPCTRDDDCDPYGGLYNCAVDRPTSGGARFVCAASVHGVAAPGDACRADGDCLSNLCVDGSCRGPCADDSGCPAGLRCGELDVAGTPLRTCRATDPVAGVTVEDYVLFEGVTRVDMTTPTFPVVLPSDVVSVTFAIEDLEGNDLLVSVANLQAPDGTAWINARTWNGIMDQPVREIMNNRQINSALAPSSDTLRVRAGRYGVSFSVVNPRGATPVAMRRVRCTARIKRAPMGTLASGALHLRLYVVGAPGGMTAASAPSNARLQSALARMTSILAPSGVRVMVDGYSEITGADGTRLGTIDSRDELGELFTHSRDGTTGDVLSLFIVHGISPGAGLENAIGVAGDIVGPAGIQGTIDSGVVAAWDTTGGSPDLLPPVLAHECSHYLGLWHTRESRPACTAVGMTDCSPFGGVDPISDTPTDDATSQTYLMHWFTNGTNTRVSAGEGVVLRAHAIVR